MALLTITPNPAIDETVILDHLTPGAVHRARAALFNAGGKGVNVASCLADWQGPGVCATGLLGAGNSAIFKALFAAKGIEDKFLRIPGETRVNIKLAHDGDTTDINLPGPPVDAPTGAALLAQAAALLGPEDIGLLAGSLPAGLNEDFYATALPQLAAGGARILLDSSGAPLRAALRAAVPPYAVKPNRAELETLLGASVPDDAALRDAALALRARGVTLAVVSLGEQGALFAGPEGVVQARLPRVAAISTVGAGDAMVAGLMAGLQDGLGLAALARLATAFAAAKLSLPGPNLPPRAQVERLAGHVTINQ